MEISTHFNANGAPRAHQQKSKLDWKRSVSEINSLFFTMERARALCRGLSVAKNASFPLGNGLKNNTKLLSSTCAGLFDLLLQGLRRPWRRLPSGGGGALDGSLGLGQTLASDLADNLELT